jgi:GH35 family endo-1,4-beta-xylanase
MSPPQSNAQSSGSPRVGTVTLIALDPEGQPVANAVISYSQVSHDFLFGTGSTHPSGRYPFSVYEDLEAIGVNYALPFLVWRNTEPNPGQYDWNVTEYLYYVNELDSRGFVLNAHCFIWLHDAWYNLPAYVRGVDFEEFVSRAYTHTRDIVTYYKDGIDMWTINEPTFPYANMLNFTEDQWVELVRTVVQTIREVDLDAQVMVNVWPSNDPAQDYYPITFLQRLLDEGVDFDVVGVELYPFGVPLDGNGYPDVGWTSSRLDAFSVISKPIVLSEVGVPYTPSVEAQSQWLRSLYTLAFNKPYMRGVTWYFAADDPFLPGAGLMNDDFTPRPIYYTLEDLIASWTTAEMVTTNVSGTAMITGYGGEYCASVMTPKCSMATRFHIFERQEYTVTLACHTLYLPLIISNY